jgi:hypothetical protein
MTPITCQHHLYLTKQSIFYPNHSLFPVNQSLIDESVHLQIICSFETNRTSHLSIRLTFIRFQKVRNTKHFCMITQSPSARHINQCQIHFIYKGYIQLRKNDILLSKLLLELIQIVFFMRKRRSYKRI